MIDNVTAICFPIPNGVSLDILSLPRKYMGARLRVQNTYGPDFWPENSLTYCKTLQHGDAVCGNKLSLLTLCSHPLWCCWCCGPASRVPRTRQIHHQGCQSRSQPLSACPGSQPRRRPASGHPRHPPCSGQGHVGSLPRREWGFHHAKRRVRHVLEGFSRQSGTYYD
ncbi:hypothetical protein BD779DRAFT_1119370 [Infundibulicybe gibba]|nr:hypothetical protein BD779DRAFT_1119370 [Infundibulicybe gibba]